MHRNSLYKTFGSKRGLYLAALRWHLEHQLPLLTERLAASEEIIDGSALDLLLMAAVERAPIDSVVAALVAEAWQALEQALQRRPTTLAEGSRLITVSALLGDRLRVRAAMTSAATVDPS